MNRLIVVKFHTNIANRWLFMIHSLHKVISTCLGGHFFPRYGVVLLGKLGLGKLGLGEMGRHPNNAALRVVVSISWTSCSHV